VAANGITFRTDFIKIDQLVQMLEGELRQYGGLISLVIFLTREKRECNNFKVHVMEWTMPDAGYPASVHVGRIQRDFQMKSEQV
jgi:hypothetical protein